MGFLSDFKDLQVWDADMHGVALAGLGVHSYYEIIKTAKSSFFNSLLFAFQWLPDDGKVLLVFLTDWKSFFSYCSPLDHLKFLRDLDVPVFFLPWQCDVAFRD